MGDRPYQHHSEAELLHTLRAYERSHRDWEKRKRTFLRQAGAGAWASAGYKELEDNEKNCWQLITGVNNELAQRRSERAAAPVATGTVRRFNAEKGYGFITPDAGGADVFVHFSAIQGSGYRTLTDGAKVQYGIVQGPKGPQAADVRPL